MRRIPLVAAKLRSFPANGHGTFLPQIRKLVYEYSDISTSSRNLRTFLLNHLEQLARDNPHVEVVVRQRAYDQPIVRGFYVNGREKVISLLGFEVTAIQAKSQLLLDSSGSKIKPLKTPVISTTESTRGIWSGLHANRPDL